jgi:hypothetical protein
MYREKNPKADYLIDNHIFMDDFVTSVADGNEAISTRVIPN